MDQDSNDSEHRLRRAGGGDEAALAAPGERPRDRLRQMVHVRAPGRLRDLLERVPGVLDEG